MAKSKQYKSTDAYLKSLGKGTPIDILSYWESIPLRRSGNGVSRRCVVVRERVNNNMAGFQLHWLPKAFHSEITKLAEPVMFHEAFTEDGKCVALPQIPADKHYQDDSWEAATDQVFMRAPTVWDYIHRGEGPYAPGWLEHINEDDCIANPNFARELDAALVKNCISEYSGHPLTRRLLTIHGWD
jgi:hypothetical protein